MDRLYRVNKRTKTTGLTDNNEVVKKKVYIYDDLVSVETMKMGNTIKVTGIMWDCMYFDEISPAEVFINILSAAITDIKNQSFDR